MNERSVAKVLTVALAIVLLPTVGCSNARRVVVKSGTYVDAGVRPKTAALHRALRDLAFTLDLGDTIKISVQNEGNLTGEYRIYPDCAIRFPLIGSVKVCGKTPDQVRDILAIKLRQRFFRNRPHVNVMVKKFRSKRVHVIGMVRKPGSLFYSPRMTVIQAIALAGGFGKTASKNATRVIRNTGSRKRVFLVPVESVGRGLVADFLLRPGDIVYVPESLF